MALNDQDGGVPTPPEDRDAPMSLEKSREIARAVSHRPDGTSQAFKTLETEISRLECLVAHYRGADSLAAFHRADKQVSDLRAQLEEARRLDSERRSKLELKYAGCENLLAKVGEQAREITSLKNAHARFSFQAGVKLGEACKKYSDLKASLDSEKKAPLEKIETDILVRCSRCGHSDVIRCDSESVVRELRACFSLHAGRNLMKLFWRGWVAALVLGAWAEFSSHLLWKFALRLWGWL